MDTSHPNFWFFRELPGVVSETEARRSRGEGHLLNFRSALHELVHRQAGPDQRARPLRRGAAKADVVLRSKGRPWRSLGGGGWYCPGPQGGQRLCHFASALGGHQPSTAPAKSTAAQKTSASQARGKTCAHTAPRAPSHVLPMRNKPLRPTVRSCRKIGKSNVWKIRAAPPGR